MTNPTRNILLGAVELLTDLADQIEKNGEKKADQPGGTYLAGIYDASEQLRTAAEAIQSKAEIFV